MYLADFEFFLVVFLRKQLFYWHMLNIRQLYLAWSCTLGWLASYPQLPHVHPWNNCEICKMFTKTIIRQVTALFTPRSNEQFSILSALYFL